MAQRNRVRGGRGPVSVSRRALLRAVGPLGVLLLSACRRRVVEVEHVVEKPVTQVVKEIVRETVVVESTPQAPIKTVEPATSPTPQPPTTVTIVADVVGTGYSQFARQMTPSFRELFPNITMNWRSISPWEGYPERVALLHASGQPGDLLEVGSRTALLAWAERQLIRPLDAIIAADGFDASGLFRSSLNAARYQNRLYALPFLGHAGENLVLYNRALFEAAGLPSPAANWTLDDLARSAKALTRDSDGDGRIDRYGFLNDLQLPGAYPLLRVLGAELLSVDGQSLAIGNGAGMECLRWLQRMGQERWGAIAVGVDQGPLELLLNGGAAMVRQDFRALVGATRVSRGAAVPESVLLPRHPRTERIGSLACSAAYAIDQQSLHPVEALQWCKFMASREMGVQMFLGGYAEPGCRAVSWKDARVVQSFPIAAQLADAIDVAEHERVPWNLNSARCLQAWNRRIGALWSGEQTPEAWVADLERELAPVLAQPVRPEEPPPTVATTVPSS